MPILRIWNIRTSNNSPLIWGNPRLTTVVYSKARLASLATSLRKTPFFLVGVRAWLDPYHGASRATVKLGQMFGSGNAQDRCLQLSAANARACRMCFLVPAVGVDSKLGFN